MVAPLKERYDFIASTWQKSNKNSIYQKNNYPIKKIFQSPREDMSKEFIKKYKK